MIAVLDTNILIRFFIGDDQQQLEQCTEFFSAVQNRSFSVYLPGIVLSELAWTLKQPYGFEKKEIVKMQQLSIALCSKKVIDGYDYETAIGLYSKKSVKFIDCVIASMKPLQQKKWAIVSFDKDFDKLGVIRKEPGEMI